MTEEKTETTETTETTEETVDLGNGELQVTAKKNDTEITVVYNFGTDLNDAIEKFGDDIVFTNYRAHSKIALQARLRACIERGVDPVAYAASWKPGMQMERTPKDPKQAALSAFGLMSEEDRMDFIAKLKAEMG